jgi:uncharacterized membrane protein SpoIIM required for sporulation
MQYPEENYMKILFYPKFYNNYNTLSFLSILKNNLFVVMLLLSGSLLFGSITLINLVYSGITLAHLVVSANTYNLSLYELLFLTLPHGIFEIPAIIIAGAAGFKIPYEIVRYLAGKKEQILTKEDIKEYLTLALISIVLIVIAAWIEANITLKIAKAMLAKGI